MSKFLKTSSCIIRPSYNQPSRSFILQKCERRFVKKSLFVPGPINDALRLHPWKIFKQTFARKYLVIFN